MDLGGVNFTLDDVQDGDVAVFNVVPPLPGGGDHYVFRLEGTN